MIIEAAIKDSVYFADPRQSQSRIKKIFQGPSDYRDNIEDPDEETAAMLLGKAFHLFLWQPELSHNVIVGPKLAANTRLGKIWEYLKEGKKNEFFYVFDKEKQPKGKKTAPKMENNYVVSPEEYEEMLELRQNYDAILNGSSDTIIVSEKQYDTAQKMAASVRKNTHAMNIIESCTEFEKAYFFEHKGIEFKAKIDAGGENFVVDSKSTVKYPSDFWYWKKDEREYNFQSEINKRGYKLQAAAYLRATRKEHFYIIFCQNFAPYNVFPRKLSLENIMEGQEQFDAACDLYNDCLINNPEFITNDSIREL